MRKRRIRKPVYEVVTTDKYELPLIVGTAKEVAAFAGTSTNNVYAALKHKSSKYRKVLI